MSEKWWIVKVHGHMSPSLVFANDDDAKAYISEYLFAVSKHTEIAPVRIVEEGEPCEWEAERWDVYRIIGEYKTVCLGMNFCPMCGRLL